MLIIRGVNVFPSQIEEQLLKIEGLSPHYQLVLDRRDNLDRMAMLVERRPGHDAGVDATLAEELQQRIKSYIGVIADIDVHSPGGVERSQGKAKRVIDHRPALS